MQPLPGRSLVLAALALALFAGSDARATTRGPVVFAASSLSEVLGRLSNEWAAAGHARPEVRVDASSRLATQIAGGAGADVFLSADVAWVEHLGTKGRVEPGSRVVLAANSLVIIGPRGVPVAAANPFEGARRVAVAGENVPVGRYAREALGENGLWESVRGRIVNGQNARQTLEFVARGDAGAGVVFRTDARADARVQVVADLPSSKPILCVGALVARPDRHADAAAFLAFLHSEPARAFWRESGFLPPPGAR